MRGKANQSEVELTRELGRDQEDEKREEQPSHRCRRSRVTFADKVSGGRA